MNDIVKQARDYARNLAGRPEDYLTWQLADEIERLRAALAQMYAWHTTGLSPRDQVRALTAAQAALNIDDFSNDPFPEQAR